MTLLSDEDMNNEMGTLREYLKRRQLIENEIQVLKDDLKELDEEFKEKFDMKTFKIAWAVAKNKAKVTHKWTFENFLSTLEDEGWIPTK